MRARAPRRQAAADDQLPRSPIRTATSTTCRTRRARRRSTSRCRTRWASAATTAASCSAARTERQPASTSGVSSATDGTHHVRLRERLVVGREVRVRDRDDAHPGRLRRADPVVRVLDRGAATRVDAEPARCLEVDVGRRLAARHLLRRDRDREELAQARRAQHDLDQLRVRRRRDRERPPRRRPRAPRRPRRGSAAAPRRSARASARRSPR